jgi:precorrin-3B methylase
MTQASNQPPLTPEELEEIEKSNKLLAVFSTYIEQLQEANPDKELPASLLYSSFVLGASAVARANESNTTQVAKDINGMRRIYQHMATASATS